ncbi:ribosome-inactivating protein bryodin II [Ricinus communis]|uniref:rRNA N-glycosylase n=1 Tax=Ricinus communis TaxID=3988 RepID=B9T1R9_RICCO|nr:ribosome-inactivating protein bryodin II [Ricinus communis]XP_025015398.1 ribosome-inactivating protein bryodin II [Ricinus communis]EEF30191.1 ricin-agglutinin family protein [Ricinus communis]|eukprot:XP_025015397.1 ribosome-inactivating protein bryodin II-like [Ricinus communis]
MMNYEEFLLLLKRGDMRAWIGLGIVMFLLEARIDITGRLLDLTANINMERLLALIGATWILWQIKKYYWPRPDYEYYATFDDPSTVSYEHTRYRTVTFNTADATRESYRLFIETLRTELANKHERSDGMKVMREPSTLLNLERRILKVELSNSETTSATLVLDQEDAYVVGYIARDQSYLLQLDSDKHCFNDGFTDSIRLPFGFSYEELEKRAGVQSRREINLGIKELECAIKDLDKTNYNDNYKSVAKSLIVCIQMVSEAARFIYIETKVCDSITEGRKKFYRNFKPDDTMLKLEKDWDKLSDAVQNLIPHLALMKFKSGDHGAGTSSERRKSGRKDKERYRMKY